MLSAKAGVTHFHAGAGERRLRCLREILDRSRFQVDLAWLYVTHVQRNGELLRDAIDLSARPGLDADLLLLRVDSLERVDLIAGGCRLVSAGTLATPERFLA